MTLSRRIVAEVVGTACLLAAVVGSGIMGEKLAGGNTAIALFTDTFAGIGPCDTPGFVVAQFARRFRCDCSFSLACALASF